MKSIEVEKLLEAMSEKYSGRKDRKTESFGSYWQFNMKGNIYNLDRFEGFLAINRLARAGAPIVSQEELHQLSGAPKEAFLHKKWGARQSFRASVGIDYSMLKKSQMNTLLSWVLENFGQKTEDLYISEKRVIDYCATVIGREPTTRGTQRTPWSGRLRPDGWWEKEELVVEFHGAQHDGQVEHFNNDYKKQVERDKRFRNVCKKENLKLIEIWYEDRHDKEKIKTLVEQALKSSSGTHFSSRDL